ncbi:MAG: HAD-IIA family hydrolase, partial [Actinomycetaceae bacterium]|nr:HAD-IIA family hydrolase [Actinomycetaceae bacterium]
DRGGSRGGGRGFGRDDRGDNFRGVRSNQWDDKQRRRAREPEIPERVRAEDLDADMLKELQSLNPENAQMVAKHLVMAGSYIDLDPEAAYAHARAAVDRASRIGIVRQAAALAAYSCGKYAEALREVRTVRRLLGTDELRAVEADCERGLGKPDKALKVIEETDISAMSVEEIAELIIVESGARADMEQYDVALLVIDDFLSKVTFDDDETRVRVLEVRVERLKDLGRTEEAEQALQEIPSLPEPVTIVDLEEVVDADTPWVPSDLRGSKNALIDTCDVLLMDLDGVCYMGTQPIRYVSQGLVFARQRQTKVVFVTNNASRTPEGVVEHLASFNIQASPEEVMTSGMDGVGILTELLPPGAKVLVVGSHALQKLVEQSGFEVVTSAEEHPAAVLQGYSPEIGWAQLSEAAYAIAGGARHIATNTDATLPTERGFALGNGSLVAAVSHATGKEPIAGGKPLPGIYRRAMAMVGGQRALCVGDRLDTDIRGARGAGFRSLHVLTGVSSAKDIALAVREERPDFLGLDMRSLAEPCPGPVKNPTEKWTVGDSASFDIRHGVIYRDDTALAQSNDDEITLTLNDYRACIAAIWEARDNGDYVIIPTINVTDNLTYQQKRDESTEADKTVEIIDGDVIDAADIAESDERVDANNGALDIGLDEPDEEDADVDGNDSDKKDDVNES